MYTLKYVSLRKADNQQGRSDWLRLVDTLPVDLEHLTFSLFCDKVYVQFCSLPCFRETTLKTLFVSSFAR